MQSSAMTRGGLATDAEFTWGSPGLPVDGSEPDVDRPDESDAVGQHRAVGHVGEDAQVHEVWSADTEAVWQRRAVGDDVVAELALGALDRDVDLAHGRAE